MKIPNLKSTAQMIAARTLICSSGSSNFKTYIHHFSTQGMSDKPLGYLTKEKENIQSWSPHH